MSGSLTRPDHSAAIQDLNRRLGILERRIMPNVPASTVLPVRRAAAVAISMAGEVFYQPVELTPDFDAAGVLSTGPCDISGGVVQPQIGAPNFTSGTLQLYRAILMVWTPDLTQRIRVRYEEIDLPSGGSWAPSAFGSTDLVIGTDLYDDGTGVASVIGGGGGTAILLANLYVFFGPIPDQF